MDKYNLLALFHNGYAPMAKGDKVVFFDKDGEEAFTSGKMECGNCYEINDGKTVFYKDGDYGIISTDGEVLVRPKYSSLQFASKNRYIAQNGDGKWGVIDANGETVLDFDYRGLMQISVATDRYFAQDGDSWVLINEKGEELTKDAYKYINSAVVHYDSFRSEEIEEPAFEPEPDSDYYDSIAVDTDVAAY